MLHGLLAAAAATGRVPALPSFPCAAGRAFVARSGEALHGYDDPHFLAYLRDPAAPAEGGNVRCAPYLSVGAPGFGGVCGDRAVWSEFQLEQDLMYPSYPHAAAELPEAAVGAEGVVAALREAEAGAGAGAWVLTLNGEPGALALLARAPAAWGEGRREGEEWWGALGVREGAERLRGLWERCPDFFVPPAAVAAAAAAGDAGGAGSGGGDAPAGEGG